jgi:predicted ATPase/class 3 adenylate cyclase
MAITFLLTDVQGSTRQWEDNADGMQQALSRHDQLIREIVSRHDGRLIKTKGEGDSTFSVFKNARRAVAAAIAVQQALTVETWPPGIAITVRMAVHTGEAQERDEDFYGRDVNRVARLRAIGHGGQILVSEITANLSREDLPDAAGLRDLGVHRLKDLTRPEHIYQVTDVALRTEFPPLNSLDRVKHNLPIDPTSFVGRAGDTRSVASMLSEARVVTITGPGRVGKTRLALQVAAELADSFPDGAWFVDLATIDDPTLLPQQVMTSLETTLPPAGDVMSNLVNSLRESNLLLVLDNCEHLAHACTTLTQALLDKCRDVRILATSREPLCVRGESVWPLPPFPQPDEAAVDTNELLRFEAVQLFLERATSVRPGLDLAANAGPVVDICRRLDGIPLAVELAASRVGVLPVKEIAKRLRDRLDVVSARAPVASARQQTLRGAIDWGHDLLSENERVLFRQISVFAGAFSFEAVDAICGDGLDVFELLPGLANRSMVVLIEDRYRMLDTIRRYAMERLETAAESSVVRRRHAEYLLTKVEAAERDHHKGDPRTLMQLGRVYDDIRAALNWSLDAAPHTAMRLCAALAKCNYWTIKGLFQEGRSLCDRALSLPAALDPQARADVLRHASTIAERQGDMEAATALRGQAIQLFRASGDEHSLAHTLAGALSAEPESYVEAAEIAARIGDFAVQAIATLNLGELERAAGNLVQARDLYESAAHLTAEPRMTAWLMFNLGQTQMALGEARPALESYGVSIQRARETDHTIIMVHAVAGIAASLAALNDLQQAARLFGAAAGLFRKHEIVVENVDQTIFEEWESRCRAELTSPALEASWAEGERMSLQAAVDHAISAVAHGLP